MQLAEEVQDAQCFECKHLIFNPAEFRCPAFPDQPIPYEILTNQFNHIKRHPEQKNDIVFERKKGDNK